MKTISVGIPVYNERDNIINLLEDIKLQEYHSLRLQDIIIYDDMSTDGTYEILTERHKSKRDKSKNIKIIRAKKNTGKAAALNIIFKECKSDVLILLDSDLRIKDRDTLFCMAQPLLDDEVGLTSGLSSLTSAKNAMARVFRFSSRLVLEIGKEKNLAICWGGIMAMNKKAYENIRLEVGSYRTDAFLYLSTLQLGLKYTLVDEPKVLDKKEYDSINFQKFARMQKRTDTYPKIFDQKFSKELLFAETRYSPQLILISLIKLAARYPVDASCYLAYKICARAYNAINGKIVSGTWRN